jgi:polyhydroxybutyrate depolymerase
MLRHLAAGVALVSLLATAAPAPIGAATTTTTSPASPTTPPGATIGSAGCARSGSSVPVAPGKSQSLSLTSGSVHGAYVLTVPRTYRSNRATPLIFLFYGDGENPADFSSKTNFPAQGAAAGDIVVVPQNQGPEIGFQYSGHGTDAAFVSAVIRSLQRSYCINRRAIFTSGFSSGAAFAILYACAHQSQIRAIASVSVDYQLGCTRPVPLLAFHGTKDPAVTYQNNTIVSQLPGITLDAHLIKGTIRNMADWVRLNRCQPRPMVTRIASQVTRSQWLACAPGTSVTFYTILGGGHEWPGAKVTTGIGLTTQQISANTLILRFFNSLARS